MQISHLSRWLTGAALAAAAAGIHTSDALAQGIPVPRVLVGGLVQTSTALCRPDADSIYTMEARGFLGNVKLCETFTQGASAMATCDLGVNEHQARVTRRSRTTLQFLNSVGSPSARTPWGTPGPVINVPVPAHSTHCPGGGNLQLQSSGITVPNGT
jgi:hypothetical protein